MKERERETERYGTIHFDNRVTFLFFFINATEMQSKEGDDSRLSSERQIGRRAVQLVAGVAKKMQRKDERNSERKER